MFYFGMLVIRLEGPWNEVKRLSKQRYFFKLEKPYQKLFQQIRVQIDIFLTNNLLLRFTESYWVWLHLKSARLRPFGNSLLVNVVLNTFLPKVKGTTFWNIWWKKLAHLLTRWLIGVDELQIRWMFQMNVLYER